MANAHAPLTAPAKARAPASIHVLLEYLGFRNTPGRREYFLRAQSGAEVREYTVWIPHTAFALRQALLQDGPDICYQKLRRELSASESGGATCIGVTESELLDYRDAHTTPPRRSSPRPASPPRTQQMTGSSLPRRDGGA